MGKTKIIFCCFLGESEILIHHLHVVSLSRDPGSLKQPLFFILTCNKEQYYIINYRDKWSLVYLLFNYVAFLPLCLPCVVFCRLPSFCDYPH